MDFQGIKMMPISELGLSQIYLNQDKICRIKQWFSKNDLDHFSPLPVHDFGNETYTLTDGHTRAFVAYQSGVFALPVIYDHDDIVTGIPGQILYQADIEWCERFHLKRISDLKNRILDNQSYQKLWIERCNRSYYLLTQTSPQQRVKLQNMMPEYFLYGSNEELSIFYYEDNSGKLYQYEKGILKKETIK